MKRIKQTMQKWFHDVDFKKEAEKRRKKGVKLKRNLDLHGKKAVIFGVATHKSIAWTIAKTLNDNGCRVALGYQDRAEEYVQELAKELNKPLLAQCDMMSDELIEEFFKKVEKEFGNFDILIHSVAFAKKDFLKGKYYDVNRRGYNTAMEVSAYSLPALVKASHHLMNDNGSIIAMTYLGSEKAVANYNMMGVAKAALESSIRYLATDLGDKSITVNAISAGPIKTLAASGVSGFDKILDIVEQRAPLHRNISQEDVGNMALFLCSDLANNITGQIMFVDSGYNIVGL